MTPNSEYLQYLDREIEKADAESNIKPGQERSVKAYWMGRWIALLEIRNTLVTIDNTQEVDNDEARQFTDGLD